MGFRPAFCKLTLDGVSKEVCIFRCSDMLGLHTPTSQHRPATQRQSSLNQKLQPGAPLVAFCVSNPALTVAESDQSECLIHDFVAVAIRSIEGHLSSSISIQLRTLSNSTWNFWVCWEACQNRSNISRFKIELQKANADSQWGCSWSPPEAFQWSHLVALEMAMNGGYEWVMWLMASDFSAPTIFALCLGNSLAKSVTMKYWKSIWLWVGKSPTSKIFKVNLMSSTKPDCRSVLCASIALGAPFCGPGSRTFSSIGIQGRSLGMKARQQILTGPSNTSEQYIITYSSYSKQYINKKNVYNIYIYNNINISIEQYIYIFAHSKITYTKYVTHDQPLAINHKHS